MFFCDYKYPEENTVNFIVMNKVRVILFFCSFPRLRFIIMMNQVRGATWIRRPVGVGWPCGLLTFLLQPHHEEHGEQCMHVCACRR